LLPATGSFVTLTSAMNADAAVTDRRVARHVGLVTVALAAVLMATAVVEFWPSSPPSREVAVATAVPPVSGVRAMIESEYRRSVGGPWIKSITSLSVKRVAWSDLLATPYGSSIAMSQMNPTGAPLYVVLVSGQITMGEIDIGPTNMLFHVLMPDNPDGALFATGFASPSTPSWFAALHDVGD
jgi:hypothetical protein